MTREEIIKLGKFISNDQKLELELYLPFFEQKVKVIVFDIPNSEAEPKINLATDIINDLLTFPEQNKVWLKQQIWNHYQAYMTNTSYGLVSQEGFSNEEEANKAYFQIFNEEDAYNRVNLDTIFCDVNHTDVKFFTLDYNCPWEDEHGINIEVVNGEFQYLE